MRFIGAAEIDAALTFPALVEKLRGAFRAGAVQPVRHHHSVERIDGTPSTLLLMPAWTDFLHASATTHGYMGVKIVTVSPDNNAVGKPAIMGVYVLLDGRTGEPLVLMDGQRLTQWRTACASALASSYLARSDASRLLVLGAGALCPFLVRAHASVRPIRQVRIWNRTPANAERAADALRRDGFHVDLAHDAAESIAWADIVCSATISSQPLVLGCNLHPGSHVDLVGGFTPQMREADDDAIRRSSVFVDTRAGATKEAGDIVQPLNTGVLAQEGVLADLHELAREQHRGRHSDSDITLFKSVGAALEDLAAAIAVYEAVGV